MWHHVVISKHQCQPSGRKQDNLKLKVLEIVEAQKIAVNVLQKESIMSNLTDSYGENGCAIGQKNSPFT